MLRRTSVALTLSVALLVGTTGSAGAGGGVVPDDIELGDVLAQVPGLIDGLLTNRADMLRCPTLAGGTIGTAENLDQAGRTGPDEGNPLRAGDASKAPASLPEQVIFRSSTETFNRRYQFVLRKRQVWYKSNTAVTGIVEPWAPLAIPDCFAGKVAGISVDDDELVAIDTDRWVYGLDGALRDPAHFNWTLRWGPPFWTGPGRKLPTAAQAWSWSVVSKLEDGTWPDDTGNQHPVGAGKVSHIWMLSQRGQRLTYLDPWLPNDQSYEMCSPVRGRFRSVNLSASGSTVFVIGRYGDMFTRLYDFDIAGADPLFFDYSYEDQRGVAKPVIQLPSPDWIRQPKVPGRITDRISIHKIGPGAGRRELRVEGRRRGKVGYWHKDVAARTWHFTRTGGRAVGKALRNPRHNTLRRGLGPSENRSYRGTAGGAQLTVGDFNVYCSPARLQVRLASGERFTLTLHALDNIRQFKQARGLSTQKRMFNGMLEISPRLRRTASPAVTSFLDRIGPGRFVRANLDGTLSSLQFRQQGWTLRAD